MSEQDDQITDVVIAGAGYVGLATAVAIKSGAPQLNISVVDGAPEGVWKRDGRASAIAAAASNMLEQLQCWQACLEQAQPINDMIVTDSKLSDPIRPTFLTFANPEPDSKPFAHMVPNVALNGALRARANALGISVTQSRKVSDFSRDGEVVTIQFADGQTTRTRLLIACDGVKSHLRQVSGIRTVFVDYGQSGIVTTVEHERPHHGRAQEHFLPAGPFAILPLKGNRSSIVWTEETPDAQRLVEMDDLLFTVELEQRFGLKLGEIRPVGGRRAFPLGLTLAREFVQPRFALAGDAAHGIHPIAGQGLNLGFKDAAALAEVVVDAVRLGLDIGGLDILERYQMWRRFDTVRMGMTTDLLNRLFSNDFSPLRSLRSFGLGVVDRLPALKNMFIDQAAGRSKDQPRLLAGQAL